MPLGFMCLTAGLVKSHCASGTSYDRPAHLRFMALLGSRSNYELVPKINVALYDSYAFLPNNKLRIFASSQLSHHDKKKIYHNTAVQTRSSAQILSFFPWLHTPNRSISSRVPSSLPNPLPYFQPIFTRRPSGNVYSSNFFFCLSPIIIICVIPFYFRSGSFCLTFVVFKGLVKKRKGVWPWSEVTF
jgi:hypothetical protein